MIRTVLSFLIAGIALAATTAPAFAQKPEVYTGVFNNLAVGGYDAVSFFDGNAVEGSDAFTTEYNGANWRFANAENLARFQADPEDYAPQYGGYCAWAVAQGYLAKGDPRFATVVAGKLYLNFNADVNAKWKADIPGFISTANDNWPGVLSE